MRAVPAREIAKGVPMSASLFDRLFNRDCAWDDEVHVIVGTPVPTPGQPDWADAAIGTTETEDSFSYAGDSLDCSNDVMDAE